MFFSREVGLGSGLLTDCDDSGAADSFRFSGLVQDTGKCLSVFGACNTIGKEG